MWLVTKIDRHSGIRLPKKPSYTIPMQISSVYPHISRRITVLKPEGLNVPVDWGSPGWCEDICSIHNPLNSEMRAKVATKLKQQYIVEEDTIFGRQIKVNWATDFGEDIGTTKLKHSITPATVVGKWTLQRFLNKPTALYLAYSAQKRDACSSILFACIYKDWFHHHADNPKFGYGHFFANPSQINSTGPKTIADICKAHKSLSNQVSSLSDQDGQAKARLHDRRSPQNYKLHPLCRAVLIILDERCPNPGGRLSIEDQIQRQNVLIVRTREEDGLSTPIIFDTIRSQSLPLGGSDVDTEESENMIRVSLRTAVKFILDLQQREEMAFPNLRGKPDNRSERADRCAVNILRKVDQRGNSNVIEIGSLM